MAAAARARAFAALACVAALAAGACAAPGGVRHDDVQAARARAAPEVGGTRAATTRAVHGPAMVVTAHRLATEAALSVLAEGGGAVDAAIAAQWVLNVVEPQSSGIGGGGFLLHYERAGGGRVRAYDGRETAPAAMDGRAFLDADGHPRGFFEAADSAMAVGVPGLVRMLGLAHSRHGRLPWARLFAPAIAVADAGFAVSPRLSASIAAASGRLGRRPATAALFLREDGSAPPPGAWLRNPALAESLRRLAADGPEALYQGPIAEAIVAAVGTGPKPGPMSRTDLAAYAAVEREPLCAAIRELRVCGVPPPSSGGVGVLQVLGILARFPPTKGGADGAPDAPSAHRIVEAMRLAYADRGRYLRDPAFGPVPVEGLLAPSYLASRAGLIDPRRARAEFLPGRPAGVFADPGADAARPRDSTTHLSIVDASGDAVALTSSIEQAFGSAIVAGGFLLNNQLTDFSFRTRDAAGRLLANRVEPGKRPRSTMAPTMVFTGDGRLLAVLGSPGGSNIIAYVARALVALIDWRLDPAEAMSGPHLVGREGRTVHVEAGSRFDALAAGLVELGHVVRRVELTSGLNAIVADCWAWPGATNPESCAPAWGWTGVADPRREGFAAAPARAGN